jgi:hypothetical protein
VLAIAAACAALWVGVIGLRALRGLTPQEPIRVS